ncbi:MAG: hypothetical protein AB2376_07925 [Clostridium sp.]
MHKRPVLHVSIRCEVYIPTKFYQQLFQYSKKVYTDKAAPRVRIHIDDFDTQEEMLCIQELMYDTVMTTNVPLKITNLCELFTALVTIIDLSLEHLQSDGLHRYEDSLIIFVSVSETDDILYNFKWSLKA